MSQIALQRSRIGPFVRQNIPRRMSEHVGVNLERYLGGYAGALDQLLKARYGERRSAFADEDER